MEQNTKTELTEILNNLDTEIAEMKNSVISTKAKLQIKNLISKIEDRKQLPNFKVLLSTHIIGEKPVELTLLDFLNLIDTKTKSENKLLLKSLQIRANGLRALLDKN